VRKSGRLIQETVNYYLRLGLNARRATKTNKAIQGAREQPGKSPA